MAQATDKDKCEFHLGFDGLIVPYEFTDEYEIFALYSTTLDGMAETVRSAWHFLNRQRLKDSPPHYVVGMFMASPFAKEATPEDGGAS